MNKIASLLAITLLLASSIAHAQEDSSVDPGNTVDPGSSVDLTYCLDLPTAQEIAKCAGEISPGSKGRIYSKEEVERILSDKKETAPASASDVADTPAAAGDKTDEDSLPEESESTSD